MARQRGRGGLPRARAGCHEAHRRAHNGAKRRLPRHSPRRRPNGPHGRMWRAVRALRLRSGPGPRAHPEILTVAIRGHFAERMRALSESTGMSLAKLLKDALLVYEGAIEAGCEPGTSRAPDRSPWIRTNSRRNQFGCCQSPHHVRVFASPAMIRPTAPLCRIGGQTTLLPSRCRCRWSAIPLPWRGLP
jgi:hypothetical protein